MLHEWLKKGPPMLYIKHTRALARTKNIYDIYFLFFFITETEKSKGSESFVLSHNYLRPILLVKRCRGSNPSAH